MIGARRCSIGWHWIFGELSWVLSLLGRNGFWKVSGPGFALVHNCPMTWEVRGKFWWSFDWRLLRRKLWKCSHCRFLEAKSGADELGVSALQESFIVFSSPSFHVLGSLDSSSEALGLYSTARSLGGHDSHSSATKCYLCFLWYNLLPWVLHLICWWPHIKILRICALNSWFCSMLAQWNGGSTISVVQSIDMDAISSLRWNHTNILGIHGRMRIKNLGENVKILRI